MLRQQHVVRLQPSVGFCGLVPCFARLVFRLRARSFSSPRSASSPFFIVSAKMGKFLHCFEGQKIEEDVCDADFKECLDIANLGDRYAAIEACVNDDTRVKAAGALMAAACKQRNPQWWPYVLVNDVLLCGDDSCMMVTSFLSVLPFSLVCRFCFCFSVALCMHVFFPVLFLGSSNILLPVHRLSLPSLIV